MTTDLKSKVLEALKAQRDNYNSDAHHSRYLGINTAQYSRIKKGEFDKVISEAKWITLARLANVQINNSLKWITVETETFSYIIEQLEFCQNEKESRIFCDRAGIGKSHAGKHYAKHNKDAVYIDGSQVKSKQKLVRKIAREFGVDNTGRYADVYEDLVYYLKTGIENPLIILDEAGDLNYDAFLELKALWNSTEYMCGWYMMGADGLEQKIDRQRDLKKVGYTEILDRFGNGYKKVSPEGKEALKEFDLQQVALVSRANKSNLTPLKMYAKTFGSLRKVRTEIKKQHRLAS